MIPQVLQAVNQAFHPANTVNHLELAQGRVFGSVEVSGSALFDSLDDARRQRLLWDELQAILKDQSVNVGPVVLEPVNRG